MPAFDRTVDPNQSVSLRRLVTDDGELLIGRALGLAKVCPFWGAFRLAGRPRLAATEVHGQISMCSPSFAQNQRHRHAPPYSLSQA